ncbi:hypothetical protein GGX14DRAFT_470440 [Mycena pura]|uniref:Uncharacterized protein n=1 Tax=Mycena pura TaxID=153505 RepID=A0AAD6UZ46_9AGAR|nr:hypothetical protein GGX14DRAFT_470440 [Mycena pura]
MRPQFALGITQLTVFVVQPQSIAQRVEIPSTQVISTVSVWRSLLSLRFHGCPPAPRISYLPLPGQSVARRPRIPPLFPINLELGISSVHTTLLTDPIPPFTTISVRDLAGSVLCNISTGPFALTSAEFAEFLHHFVRSSLPSRGNLAPRVLKSVQAHFLSRHGPNGRETWQRYNETTRFGAPTGLDLLLGHTLLWSLHPDPWGVWVATVDVAKDPGWQH